MASRCNAAPIPSLSLMITPDRQPGISVTAARGHLNRSRCCSSVCHDSDISLPSRMLSW